MNSLRNWDYIIMTSLLSVNINYNVRMYIYSYSCEIILMAMGGYLNGFENCNYGNSFGQTSLVAII